jgi:hypothetical protein
MMTLAGVTDTINLPLLPPSRKALPPPQRWHSATMNLLEDVATPGTVPNIAVSVAVTTLVLPRIQNRLLAAATGLAVGLALGR